MPRKERLANIELLRVIAMIMVTMLHALGHGGVLQYYQFGTIEYFCFSFLEMICCVAVNVFVLITGYFMTDSELKISKVFKLGVQIEMYSLFCLFVSKIFLKEAMGMEELVRAVFPISANEYWFASAYMVLMLLSPLLNWLIRVMDQKIHYLLLAWLSVVFCIIPTFVFWSRPLLTNGYDFVWFIILYLTAAYIRRYSIKPGWPWKRWMLIYLIFAAIGTFGDYFIGQTSLFLFKAIRGEEILTAYNSIIIFPSALCIFRMFQEMQIKNKVLSKGILSLGAVCFGAYLITEHPLIRSALWSWLDVTRFCAYTLPVAFTGIFAVVWMLFLVGCIVEWVRKALGRLIRIEKIFILVDCIMSQFKTLIFSYMEGKFIK